MDRNDDNKDIIREARQKAKNEKEPKKNLTADEKDTKKEVKEKIVNDEELKDKKTNKNKIYIGMICFFVLIGIMYFSAKRYDNLVYPNIYLYEEDVSKLNKEKLNDKIDILINDINKKLITIKVKDKKYEIKVCEIIKKIDKNKTANEIMSYGKDKFFMEQFGLIYLNVAREYKFNMKIDNDVIQEKVNEIYKETTISAIEPTLEIDDENVKIISGKDGQGIDKKSLTNKIIDSINSDEIGKTNIVLTEEYKIIKSQINEKDLVKVKDKISTATTYFGGTGYNRGLNIANAASKINGTLLMFI